jgi:hypothetical protein
MDLVDERVIPFDQGESMSKWLTAFFSEVPAKTGLGIDELFVRIAEEVLKRIKGEESEVPASAAPKVELKEDIEPRKKKKKKKGFY